MKHSIGLLIIGIFLSISFGAAWSYPVRTVTLNNCDDSKELCTFDLPRIYGANYTMYADDPLYRRVYTVLWGATYPGQRDQGQGSHKGVDIASIPETPVYAIGDGVVLDAGWRGNRGNVVVIAHDYGTGKIYSSYAHLGAVFVEKGASIYEGDILGEIGDTGNAFGPHLHFQIDTNQNGVYPFHFYNCPGSLTQIVNDGLCRNQLIANTLDPIVFLEQQMQSVSSISSSDAIIFTGFVGGYGQLDTLEFLYLRQDNVDKDISPITIEFDATKVNVFPAMVDFIGSQRTIYIRGLQSGITMLSFVQDGTVIKRVPLIVGTEKLFRLDNQTIIDIFERFMDR